MRIPVRIVAKSLVLAIAGAALLGTVASAAEPAQENPAATIATLEKQAAEFRAAAARHDSMAMMHRGGAGSSKVNHEAIARHCDAIARNLRAAAKESEDLAAEYRKEGAK
ncbi:MAG TPA: hypothetical protein VFS13_01490 [Steroidobacteraceae bacterium]|nr:hypothetical protein [Steroidobacteraceae bacterium]